MGAHRTRPSGVGRSRRNRYLVGAAAILAISAILLSLVASAGRPRRTTTHQRAETSQPQSSSRLQPRDLRVLASGASRSFERLRAELPGRVEIAVTPLGEGQATVLGGNTPAQGWSVTKVPVLIALMKAHADLGEPALSRSERALAHSAITESDNQSILQLFSALEKLDSGLAGASRAVEAVLRLGGDADTTVTTAPPPPGAVTTFGQTPWSASAAATFFRAFADGCLLSAADTGYLLGLMREIVPSESWGLGSGGFASIAFKGGWGPDPAGRYLVRQSGIIDSRSFGGVSVSIVAFPASGSFTDGTAIVTRAAQWLHRELRLTPREKPSCRNG